jgi:hypothetical protein
MLLYFFHNWGMLKTNPAPFSAFLLNLVDPFNDMSFYGQSTAIISKQKHSGGIKKEAN